MTDVRVGDVWADNDYRCEGRTVMVVAITDGKAICSVAWPNLKHGRVRHRTAIRLDRFRPNSTGYRLISRVRGDLTRSQL